jgi:hypothetical protein
MSIDLEIKGLKETQAEMERIVRDLHGEPFLNGMRRATLLVQRDAKKKAPPEIRTQGNDTVGVVGSNVKYAPFQELGTRPHFVPGKYIGAWAAKHGFFKGMRTISTSWGLFVKGTAHPFLEPAFVENTEKIVGILGDTVAEIVSRKD